MKKYLALSILLFSFSLFAACTDEKIVQATVNPSAQPLLETMTVYAKTVEAIGGSATAFASTLTPTPTPTNVPDPKEVTKTINNAIKDQLVATFGTRITVQEVKFGPIGAQVFTNLYIEIDCEGQNNTVCPTSQVIIAVLEACKDKKNKILENIPGTTQVLTITIFDPVNNPKVAEANWSDVLNYMNNKAPGEDFSKFIRYIQY